MACCAFVVLLGLSFLVSVTCQTNCFANTDCGGTSVQVTTGNATAECCTRYPIRASTPEFIDAQGLSYQDPGGSCMNCPSLFGFDVSNFEGTEVGEAYVFPVGFYSGPLFSSAFTVVVNLDLFGIITETDIKLNTPRLEFEANTPFVNVTISIIPDNVAQELNETFFLTLTADGNSAMQVFNSYSVMDRVEGLAIDSDGASFILSQLDYSALESARVILARIQKAQEFRLANPVFFNISPLTVQQGIDMNLMVPQNVLDLRDRADFTTSPPYAVAADFNTTMFIVEFPADELTSRVPNIPVLIGIDDDNINENDQVFLITTSVAAAVNPPLVNNTGRNISIGRILDNDGLTIGFERSIYIFDEPPAVSFNTDVMLVRDRPTEQTFSVLLGEATAENYSPLSSSDYRLLSSGVQTFVSTMTSLPLSIFLLGDTFFEGEEAVVITSRSAPGREPIYPPPTSGVIFANTTVVIRDDEVATIGFEQPSYTVMEQGGAFEVCVVMTVPALEMEFIWTGEIVLGIETMDGTADDMDYVSTTSSTTNVTFQSSTANDLNARRMCVSIEISDDQQVEELESFTLHLVFALPSRNVILNPNVTEVFIVDNEALVIGFNPATYTVLESDSEVVFSIVAFGGMLTGTINIEFFTADGTAVGGTAVDDSDYVSIVQSVTFGPGITSSTVVVPIMSDFALENNETFFGNLRFPSGFSPDRVRLNPALANATIVDDDAVVIGFLQNYMVIEDANDTVFVGIGVQSGSLGRDVVVSISTRDGTAVAVDDYVAISSMLLTFNAGSTDHIIAITIVGDLIVEENERFFVDATLFSTDAPTVRIEPNFSEVEIEDDDTLQVGLAASSYSVPENQGFVNVTVNLLGRSTRDVVVLLQTMDGSAVSTGGENDFEAISRTLTFSPSASAMQSIVVPIRIVDDAIVEMRVESLNVMLSLAIPDAAVMLGIRTATIDITDDDDVVIGFEQSSYVVNEQDGMLTVFVAILSGALRIPVRVNVSTADGTALAGSDYTSVFRTLTFDRLSVRLSISIPIIDNNIYELNEDFSILLSTGVSGGVVILNPASANVLILDNEEVSFSFRMAVRTVVEQVGRVDVIIDRSGDTDVDFLLSLSGSLQAETGQRIDQILNFTASETDRTVSFFVIDDNIALEPMETLVWTLTLANMRERAEVSPFNTTNIVILDDDELIISLEPQTMDVPESENMTAFIVFSNPFAQDFIINISSIFPDNTTVPGIATTNADFLDFSGFLIARQGVNGPMNPLAFNITIVDDNAVEDEQCFSLTIFLGTPETTNLLIAVDNGTGIFCIQDDDRVSIGFLPIVYFATETSANVRLTVQVISGVLERPVQVFFSTNNGTATTPADFIGVSNVPLQYDSVILSNTIVVPLVDDNVLENNEFFYGNLTTTDPAVDLSAASATVTIFEVPGDDTVTVGFQPVNYTFSEVSGFAVISASLLQGTLEKEVTVVFFTSPGTATQAAPMDYRSTTIELTYSSTVNQRSVQVQLFNDSIVEGQEYFFGNLMSNNQQEVIANPDLANVIITEDASDQVIIGFDPASLSVLETGGSVTFTVRVLNGTLERSVVVTFFTTDGTATSTAPQDFVNRTNVQLVFDESTLSHQVTVTIIDDAILEYTESFFGNLSTADGAVQLSPATATVSIQEQPGDDTVTIGFMPDEYTVNEVDGSVTLDILLLRGTLERNVTVPFSTSSGSAIGGQDYESRSLNFTFTPSVSFVTATVSIVNDTNVESTETFFGNIDGTADLVIASPDTATVTIEEDLTDSVTIGFDPNMYVVSETAGYVTFSILRLFGTLERSVTVVFSTMDGLATSTMPTDYNAVSGLQLIFDGTTSVQMVNVTIVNDDILEDDENFFGGLSTNDSQVFLQPISAEVTIEESFGDDIVTIGFRPQNYTVNEESGFVTLMLELLQGTLERNVSVVFNTRSMTATQEDPMDYEGTVTTLVFTPLASQRNVIVTIFNDNILEGQEYFTGNIMGSPGLVTAQPDISYVTINEDVNDRIVVGFRPDQYLVRETQGFVSLFIVMLQGTLERDAVIFFSTTDGTASSSAPTDFNAVSNQPVVFNAITNSSVVSVTIVDDNIVESQEFFFGNLSTSDSGVTLQPAAATVEILATSSNEEAVTIGFDPASLSVFETNGSVTFTVRVLNGTLERSVVVTFFTTDGTATSTAPRDYDSRSNVQLVFDESTLTHQVTVTIIDDAILENSEFFFGNLNTSDNDVVQLSPESAQVTVLEQFGDDAITVGFSPVNYTVNEVDGSVALTAIIIVGILERDVGVPYNTRPGTATDSVPVDYDPESGTLIFTPETNQNGFTVSINNDSIVEGPEFFFAELMEVPGLVRTNPNVATVTIVEDPSDRVSIGFEFTEYSVSEGFDTEVCATLNSGVLERAATVMVASADVTATATVDYTPVMQTLTFTPTDSRLCFQFMTINDTFLESTESVDLILTSSDSMVDIDSPMAVVQILDDDEIVIGFERTRFEVNEDTGNVELCVAILSGTTQTDVVARLSTRDITAEAITDYSSLNQTLTFTATETRFCYNVSIVDDRLFEGQEEFLAILTGSSASAVVMPGVATVIINDEDEIVIGFARTTDNVLEFSPGYIDITVQVRSGTIQGRTVNVSYSTAMSTATNAATSGVDFTSTSGLLVFSSSVTSRIFRVPIIDDSASEGVETFLAQLTMADDLVVLDPDVETIEILDDEVINIGFIDLPYQAEENDGVATLVVGIISGNLQREFVVSFTTEDIANVSDAATETVDYEPLSMELTFNSSTRRLEVNVTLIDDSETEYRERFMGRLDAVTTGIRVSVSPDMAEVTIIDNDRVVIGMDRARVPVNEEDGTVELCASVMSGALQREALVNVVYEDRGARSGSDYINTMMTLVFDPDVTTVCFNVPIIDDDDYENAEEFFANLTTTDTQVVLSPRMSVVIIIDSDRVVIGWERPVYLVMESAGVVELCAVASIAGSIQATLPAINIQLTDGSATSVNDYGSFSPISFSFSLNSPLRQCTDVVIVMDNNYENMTENFFATLSSASSARIDFNRPQTEVLITDDDTVVIGFDPVNYMIMEGGGSIVLSASVISRNLDPGLTIDVIFATMGGSASSGLDYEAVSTTLTFSSSSLTVNQTVNILEDSIDEPDESFTAVLTLVMADSRVTVAPNVANVVIGDNDVARIGFEQVMYRTRENSSVDVCVIVFPSTSLGRQVNVMLQSQDDTAVSMEDYNSVATTLTFSPNISRQCVTFNIYDSGVVEGQESFNAVIMSGDDVELRPNRTQVVILEDENVLISFEQPVYSFNEDAGTVSIAVIKDGDSDEPIVVQVVGGPSTVPDVILSAPAINATLTFNPGQFRQVVSLTLTDDMVSLEPLESYIVRLSIISGTDIALTGSPDVTEINVEDNDELVIGFGRPNVTVLENVGTFMMCVVQQGESAVDYNVNITPKPGTAVAGADYDASRIPSSVTISRSGDGRACFNSSSIINDGMTEGSESFTLEITSTNPASSNIIVNNPVTEIIIVDDDDNVIQVNDTVIGDPLYTVPILVPEEQLQALNMDSVTLCYEVHGQSGHWFNLVTDECASVNTRYSSLSDSLNIMDSVAVRAVDDAMNCVNVRVDVQQCAASVDGVPLSAMGQYTMNGVSVRRYSNRVRISVPNCQDLTLVMWVICEFRTLEDPDEPGVMLSGNMIKFVVMRGLNFGHRQAHGLLGQFWNTRVNVVPFTGTLYDGSPAADRYVVNITTGGKPRSFTGWKYDLTWDHSEGPCLYVGNRQSGPIGEVTDPNEPVIESLYTSYRVQGPFDEGENYMFGMFDSSKCSIAIGSGITSS